MAQCNHTIESLSDQLKEYNALFLKSDVDPGKLKFIFNQTFEPGTEDDPKCKRCNNFIANHPAQAETGIKETSRALEAMKLELKDVHAAVKATNRFQSSSKGGSAKTHTEIWQEAGATEVEVKTFFPDASKWKEMTQEEEQLFTVTDWTLGCGQEKNAAELVEKRNHPQNPGLTTMLDSRYAFNENSGRSIARHHPVPTRRKPLKVQHHCHWRIESNETR
jgi:hypothetical protein